MSIEEDIDQVEKELPAVKPFFYGEPWERLKTAARIGGAVQELPNLLTLPHADDRCDNLRPTYVQLGVNEKGDWSITRWIDADPFDEDPIGEGNTPLEAVADMVDRTEQVRRELATADQEDA